MKNYSKILFITCALAQFSFVSIWSEEVEVKKEITEEVSLIQACEKCDGKKNNVVLDNNHFFACDRCKGK